MKPKKPHPRKLYERPNLRRMAAPPPGISTACRSWNCAATTC